MATGTQIDVVMPQMGGVRLRGDDHEAAQVGGRDDRRRRAAARDPTDKVDTEVPSPGEGVVAKIMVQEGETVEVGTVLAVIAPEGAEVAAPEPAEAPPEPATQAAADASEAAASETAEPTPPAPAPEAAPAAPPTAAPARPATAAPSSPRWSPGSPPSTASTPARSGHRRRRPRDEEGHPRVRRGRRTARGRARRTKCF